MRLPWLLFLFNTVIRVEDKRLTDRFDMVHIKTTPVRVALPVNTYDMSNLHVQEMLSSTTPMLKHMNFTINVIKSYGVGYRTAHGNYTAFLGSLMENTSDFAFYGTPLGSFSYPGLVPGPVMSGLSLRIYSQIGKSVVVRGDVLDTFKGLPVEVKLYIAAAVHIIACCMSPASRKFFSGYFDTTWHSVLGYLDQENYAVKSTTRRILWLSFNVFAFVSMFGYILNLMSTDAFVALPPRRIEAIKDVFDPYFMDRNIRYYLTANDFFFNYVRESKPGTAMHKLYEHMNSTNDCTRLETCNFLEINTGQKDSVSTQQKMVAMLQEKSEKDDSALFVTSQLADNCVIPAVCRIKPDWMNKLFVSPHTVVEDVSIMLQRADLGIEIGRYLRYKFSSFFEFGRLWRYVGIKVHLIADKFSQGKDFRYYTCMERKRRTYDDVLVQVTLTTYTGLIRVSAHLIIMAFLVLLPELFVRHLSIDKKKKNSSSRRLWRLTRRAVKLLK